MVTVNAVKDIDGDKQWVFITLTVDSDTCRYTSVQPWNTSGPVLEGEDLEAFCNGREDTYQVEILKGMYPNARYQDSAGDSELEKFTAWITAGHTNAAYCSIAEHDTEETCLANGGTWVAEEVIAKVPFTDSHDLTGNQRTRKLESVRAGAKTQIEDVAGYPQWFQNNCANGLYPSATGDAMTAYIALVITESNRCEDLVEVAATIDDALAVEANWPSV